MITRYGILIGDVNEKMRRVRDNCIDLILTSPPYDELRQYDLGNRYDFPDFAEEAYRVLVPGGVLVWVTSDQTINGSETGSSMGQALFMKHEVGFNLHDTMIYERASPPKTHNRYEQRFEFMFVLSKGRPNTFNPILVPKSHPEKKPRLKGYSRYGNNDARDMGLSRVDNTHRIKDNIWKYHFTHRGDKAFVHEHPAIFPDQLAHDHIYTWTKPQDWVLDPFLGSGTTIEQALRLGRNSLGIEKSPQYVEIAKRRISLLKGQNETYSKGQRP